MPTKPGAGGKPQAYGKGGKYTKSGGRAKFAPTNGANPEPRAEQRLAQMKSYWGAIEVDNMASRMGEGLRMSMDGAKAPRIRVSYDVLEKVIADGRFKTQHETGKSNGMFDPSKRDEHEAKMFSTDQPRPIYGYVNPRSIADTYRSQGQYGEIAVVLKPEVAARTTVTYGDSLDITDVPAPIPFTHVEKAPATRLLAAATGVGYSSRPSYVEAQIHDGVSVADIDYIEVPTEMRSYSKDYSIPPTTVTAETLQAKYPDLDIRVLDGDVYDEQSYGLLSVETLAARVL